MAKKLTGYVKLQVPAGSASPSPPIGPALGQAGLNIMDFCKAFNAQTEKLEKGMPCPVVITVFQDKSFEFIVKKPPKITLTKEADYFEIRNISENSSPIDTKKFIVNNSDSVKTLEPLLPFLLNHNTNSYKEHLRSAIISEIY